MKHILFVCTIIFSFTLYSINKASGQPPLTIGILTDVQYCNCSPSGPRQYISSPAKLDSCIAFFNEKKASAVFHLGDMIDHKYISYDSMLPRFSRSNAPVFFVLGNHDYMVDDLMKDSVLRKLNLPNPYYTTTIGNWKFIILNGDDLSYQAPMDKERKAERDSIVLLLWQSIRCNMMPWNGGVGKLQVEWLRNELSLAQEKHQQVIVMCHFPVYPADCFNLYNDRQIVNLLSEYSCVKAYFNGHHHSGNYGYRNGIHFVNFKGMVDTPVNSFALVTLRQDSILIDGQGRETDRRLKVEGGNLEIRTRNEWNNSNPSTTK